MLTIEHYCAICMCVLFVGFYNVCMMNAVVFARYFLPLSPSVCGCLSHRVLHLVVVHQVEVYEHADCRQGRLHVGQLKVAEAEVHNMQGLG